MQSNDDKRIFVIESEITGNNTVTFMSSRDFQANFIYLQILISFTLNINDISSINAITETFIHYDILLYMRIYLITSFLLQILLQITNFSIYLFSKYLLLVNDSFLIYR